MTGIKASLNIPRIPRTVRPQHPRGTLETQGSNVGEKSLLAGYPRVNDGQLLVPAFSVPQDATIKAPLRSQPLSLQPDYFSRVAAFAVNGRVK